MLKWIDRISVKKHNRRNHRSFQIQSMKYHLQTSTRTATHYGSSISMRTMYLDDFSSRWSAILSRTTKKSRISLSWRIIKSIWSSRQIITIMSEASVDREKNDIIILVNMMEKWWVSTKRIFYQSHMKTLNEKFQGFTRQMTQYESIRYASHIIQNQCAKIYLQRLVKNSYLLHIWIHHQKDQSLFSDPPSLSHHEGICSWWNTRQHDECSVYFLKSLSKQDEMTANDLARQTDYNNLSVITFHTDEITSSIHLHKDVAYVSKR